MIDAAAKVGGIIANSENPVDFLLQNLVLQNNLVEASADFGVKKFLFLGSSCIYPKFAPQPISEDSLLTAPLEPTNEAYAIAKIAGIRLCQAYASQYGKNFLSAMPTNLYGPNDNYDLRTSHVLPALIRKAHEAKVSGAKTLTVWGSGNPKREFMHSDDMGDACLFLMKNYDSPEVVNIGFGEDISIRDVATIVSEAVGFEGELVFDSSKPDGTPRKLLDSNRLFFSRLEAVHSPSAGHSRRLRVVSRESRLSGMLAEDTIAAISTPPGEGAVAVIRISGPDAVTIAGKIFKGRRPVAEAAPRTFYFGSFEDAGERVDEGLLAVFRAPHSYTGENLVELHGHGGVLVAAKLLEAVLEGRSSRRRAG